MVLVPVGERSPRNVETSSCFFFLISKNEEVYLFIYLFIYLFLLSGKRIVTVDRKGILTDIVSRFQNGTRYWFPIEMNYLGTLLLLLLLLLLLFSKQLTKRVPKRNEKINA